VHYSLQKKRGDSQIQIKTAKKLEMQLCQTQWTKKKQFNKTVDCGLPSSAH